MSLARLRAALLGLSLWCSTGVAAAQEGRAGSTEVPLVAVFEASLVDASMASVPPPAPPAPPAARADPAPIVPCSVRDNRKRLAMGGVALTYAATTAWAYFAWFRGATYSDFYVAETTWFGRNVYSGGADKAGHLWATYALARVTSESLVAGGWRRWPSSLIGSALALAFFTLSEVEDGFVWGFELSDMVGNAAGAGLSLLLLSAPRVDELIDLRVEYLPTREYRDSLIDDGNLDFAQDYSGQSYMLALHLDALSLPGGGWLGWADYLDVVAGFETRNYTPTPYDDNAVPRQVIYLGAALNLQKLLARILPPSPGRKVGDLAFEMVSPPFTTLKLPLGKRSPR